MKQTNLKSGFQRHIMREQLLAATEPQPMAVGVAQGGHKRKLKRSQTITKTRSSKDLGGGLTKPAELAGEDSLLLYAGQLIQTSKQRPDGWAFGSVAVDVMDDRPPVGVDGMSTQAGWFPLSCTDIATAEQLATLQKRLGGEGANEALQPPPTWEPVKDPMMPQLFMLKEGPEKQKVVTAFMKTLGPNIKPVSVERIENHSMWQSYAVKRQTVLTREKDGDNAGHVTSTSRFERVWLFHGTDELTVPKIIEMGFNRSFCGKNATAYDFARDASYSSSTTYSRPNSKGVQHMFLCRITVGEYCVGKRDALTPDVRKGHQLYDTTVNDKNNPAIYVTYHDAQAYPEYLVKFKQ